MGDRLGEKTFHSRFGLGCKLGLPTYRYPRITTDLKATEIVPLEEMFALEGRFHGIGELPPIPKMHPPWTPPPKCPQISQSGFGPQDIIVLIENDLFSFNET